MPKYGPDDVGAPSAFGLVVAAFVVIAALWVAILLYAVIDAVRA